MARFLCQLCYTIVHYGEKHSCFVYGSYEDLSTIVQLHESEETDINHYAMTEESNTGNMNDSSATSSNIRKNNADWPTVVISQVAKHNEQTLFFPASKRKGKYGFICTDTSNNTNFESFLDGALRNFSAEIRECEGNLDGNNAGLETIWNSENAFESSTITASPFGKTELSEFEPETDHLDTRISTVAAPDSFSSKENEEVDIQKSNEYMKVADTVAGPSGCSQRLPARAEKLKFTGDLCSKQFKSEAGLVRHYRTHTGEKKFECDFCGKQFMHKGHFDRHNRSHAGEKPFECEICKKKFADKHNLEHHYNTHRGEKPFVCAVCNKGFASRSNLSAHRLTHTEVKAFKCGVCGQAFKSSAVRNKHQKEKHPDASQQV